MLPVSRYVIGSSPTRGVCCIAKNVVFSASWLFLCLWLSVKISCFLCSLSRHVDKTKLPKLGRKLSAFCSVCFLFFAIDILTRTKGLSADRLLSSQVRLNNSFSLGPVIPARRQITARSAACHFDLCTFPCKLL